MKRKMAKAAGIIIASAGVLSYLIAAQAPTRCPYVNPNTGLECLGIPVPNGVSVAGDKWRCTANPNHTWIVRN